MGRRIGSVALIFLSLLVWFPLLLLVLCSFLGEQEIIGCFGRRASFEWESRKISFTSLLSNLAGLCGITVGFSGIFRNVLEFLSSGISHSGRSVVHSSAGSMGIYTFFISG